jgi:hypothetical protein
LPLYKWRQTNMYIYRIKPDSAVLGAWKLGDATLTVGRGEGITVRIPGYRMSEKYFSIARVGDAFVLQDLD